MNVKVIVRRPKRKSSLGIPQKDAKISGKNGLVCGRLNNARLNFETKMVNLPSYEHQ